MTEVTITVVRDDTYEVCEDADFFLYKLDQDGNEISYQHLYLSGAKSITVYKNPGERYVIRFVVVPGLEIEEPEDGVFASFEVSTSPTQKIEVEVTPKKKYHLKIISFGVSTYKMIITCPNCRKRVSLKNIREIKISGKKIYKGICPYCEKEIYTLKNFK